MLPLLVLAAALTASAPAPLTLAQAIRAGDDRRLARVEPLRRGVCQAWFSGAEPAAWWPDVKSARDARPSWFRQRRGAARDRRR